MDADSDSPQGGKIAPTDAPEAEKPAASSAKAEGGKEAAGPTKAELAAAAAERVNKVVEGIPPKMRAFYRNFSLLVGAFGLAIISIATVPFLFVKDSREELVKIQGELAELSIKRGKSDKDNVFEFRLKNQSRTFVVRGLHIADQQLLVQEGANAYLTINISKKDSESDEKKVEVLALRSVQNLYLQETDYARMMLKVRFFLVLVLVTGLTTTLYFTSKIKTLWKKTIEMKPEAPLRPDFALLFLAERIRFVALLIYLPLASLAAYVLNGMLASLPYHQWILMGLVAVGAGLVAFLAPKLDWVEEVLALEAKAQAIFRAGKPQTEKPNYLKALDFILKNPAKINIQNSEGQTPLHIAVVKGHMEVVEVLISRGALVDLKDSNGQTPLMLAVKGPTLGIVLRLLEAGADPLAGGNAGQPGSAVIGAARANPNKSIGSAIERAVAQAEAKRRSQALNKKESDTDGEPEA